MWTLIFSTLFHQLNLIIVIFLLFSIGSDILTIHRFPDIWQVVIGMAMTLSVYSPGMIRSSEICLRFNLNISFRLLMHIIEDITVDFPGTINFFEYEEVPANFFYR